jgi:hypothetical protein
MNATATVTTPTGRPRAWPVLLGLRGTTPAGRTVWLARTRFGSYAVEEIGVGQSFGSVTVFGDYDAACDYADDLLDPPPRIEAWLAAPSPGFRFVAGVLAVIGATLALSWLLSWGLGS